MPRIKEDRVKVTLTVDREIYLLAQRKSKVEQKPISRIFDETIAAVVEPYRYPTPEDAHDMMSVERLEQEIEKMAALAEDYAKPAVDTELAELLAKIQDAPDNESRTAAIQELNELQESRKEKDEFRQRWIKYCSDPV